LLENSPGGVAGEGMNAKREEEGLGKKFEVVVPVEKNTGRNLIC
jgi:hypothetical protein